VAVRRTSVQITLNKDGMTTVIPAGSIVHVPAGSAQETAMGTGNMTTVTGSTCDQGQGGHATSNRG
jgi:hypothetical protein